MSTNDETLSPKAAAFLGSLIAFRQSLKLTHWSITGPGSYEAHLSLDQAIDTFTEVTDRLVETTYAVLGTLYITIPQTTKPANYIQHIESFYESIEKDRGIFTESFSQSIIDDFQEGIKQLLYRLKRLA
jgi:DNA-binding ferritin-like protein